jgi:hypothetical protein
MSKPAKTGLPVSTTSRLPAGYARLLGEIKARIRSAQYEALRAVNQELVNLYWDIGRTIAKRQAASAHGEAVVKRLAADLQKEFPGIAGFSWRNLFYMTEFYAAYRNLPKLQPMVATIGMILCRTKDRAIVEYALRESSKPIGVATYQIVKRLPKELADQLPNPRQIEALMLELENERRKP